MRKYGCLGITIIGQTTPDGSNVGIYVGGVQENSAASHCLETIDAGDRVVTIDGEDIRCLGNDEAVQILQQRVQLCLVPRSIKTAVRLGLAKYIDVGQRLERVRQEQISQDSQRVQPQPINPAEWVQNHSDFYNSFDHGNHHSYSSDTSSSIISSTECEYSLKNIGSAVVTSRRYNSNQVKKCQFRLPPLSIQTPMRTVCRVGGEDGSGLKIRDRNWLRVVIKNAFLGADFVDWLHDNVSGLEDRRDAKQYTCSLFQAKLIKPTIQARTDKFKEKSYYQF